MRWEETGDLLPLAAESEQGGDGDARATTTPAEKPDPRNAVADDAGEKEEGERSLRKRE